MKRLFPVIVLLLIALLGWFYFIRKPDFASLSRGKRFNVLLITLDTTRADRLSCYGYKGIRTPNIDALASKGILYEKCITPTPLTLPAHASLFTGTYPLLHGVRDNAAFIVPQDLTMLAEVFKQKGYKTGAFVSSFVLDSKWGINQGFDHYLDDFDLHQENIVSVGDIQRPGNQTVDAALAWLSNVKSSGFFLWVHLYDPHTPYEPPLEFKQAYPGNPYLGEIAFGDKQVGRLLTYLDTTDLRKNTYIVLAGDHGESLGEHKEDGHGFFIYEETLHVPLIISTPFPSFQGLRKKEIVSLVDVTPTILDMVGFQASLPFQGRTLLNEFSEKSRNDAESFVYSETFYPRFHFGWSELQSIQDDHYKFILSSDSELFDLQSDPEETTNLAGVDRYKTSAFRSKAESLIARWSQGAKSQDYSHLDEETQEKLAALGYIGTFSDTKPNTRVASPREKIDIYTQLSAARELSLQSEFEKAERLTLDIIKKDPGIIDSYSTLGNIYLKQNRYPDALESYRKALALKPDDTALITGIAGCHLKLDQKAEAEKVLVESLKIVPSDSRIFFMLGNVYRAQGQEEKAIGAFRQCLKLNPKSASAYNALAAIHFVRKDFKAARENVEAAARYEQRLPGIHYTRAQILEVEGNLQEAIEEYKKELQIFGKNFRAAYNLSALYRQLGKPAEEEEYLRKSIQMNDEFPLSYLYLARIQLKSQKNYDEAIGLVNKSLELNPQPKYEALAYFLLADLYNRTGDQALSRKYLLKGQNIHH